MGYLLPTFIGSTGMTVELSREYLFGLCASLNYTQFFGTVAIEEERLGDVVCFQMFKKLWRVMK